MCNERLNEIMAELKKPFHPSEISWKPGAVKGDRALAMPYADLRAYMNRLDAVCGADWSIAYEPWGEDRIICRLTICGVTRSSTGETTKESDRNEIGGTVAEAQAAKRACAFFGLGRYLYTLPTGWADFDPTTKRFTEKAKARLMGILVQQYRRATESKVELAEIYNSEEDAGDIDEESDNDPPLLKEFDALGAALYGDQWPAVRKRNAKRISSNRTERAGELTPDEITKLVVGMKRLKEQREPSTGNADIEFGMGERTTHNAPASPQEATTTIRGDNGQSNPFNDAMSFYERDWRQLTGPRYDLVRDMAELHDQSDGPCSAKQYQYLTGIIDALTNEHHNYTLSILCQSEISGGNMPGRKVAGTLLKFLPEAVVQKDSDGKPVKDADGKSVMIPNPDYNRQMAEMITEIGTIEEMAVAG